jgi:hypothetical protein
VESWFTGGWDLVERTRQVVEKLWTSRAGPLDASRRAREERLPHSPEPFALQGPNDGDLPSESQPRRQRSSSMRRSAGHHSAVDQSGSSASENGTGPAWCKGSPKSTPMRSP